VRESTKNLVEQAESLQNTINERVLPGLEAAVKSIQDVAVQSDIAQGVAAVRAVAQNLDGFSQALGIGADALEAANKDGSD
jgi:hypothetical protein